MKLNKKTTIILCALLIISIYQGVSQNNIDTNLLIGTWVFDYDQSILEMDTQVKTKFDAQIKKAYKGKRISFMEDGTYLLEQSSGLKIYVKWRVKNKIKYFL